MKDISTVYLTFELALPREWWRVARSRSRRLSPQGQQWVPPHRGRRTPAKQNLSSEQQSM